MLKRSVVSLIVACLFALSAFASTALANGSGGEVDYGPWALSDVVFDGDYAYWVQKEKELPVAAANSGGGDEPKPRRKVIALIQQQLSTGASRRMFATTSERIEFKDIVANAGRLAFTTRRSQEAKQSKPVAVDTYTVYAMGAADATPVVLDSEQMVYRGKFKTKKHKGEKYKYFEAKFNCGDDVRANDVSELGVVLVTRTSVSCSKKKVKSKKASASNGGGDYKFKAFGYAPGVATPTAYGDAPWGPLRLRGNELIGAGPDKTVVARDVSSGALRSYANQPEPSDIVVSPDRRIAITSNTWNGKSSPPTQAITVFPPAAADPAVSIPIPAGEASSVTFCGDYLLQVSGPVHKESSWGNDRNAKGPLRLTLRDFTGAVVAEVPGPASGQFAGATCTDRLATVATRSEGPMALSQFAL